MISTSALTKLLETGEANREGAHVYCHSRKDGKDGCVYLIINNSRTETTTVELPGDAKLYLLEGKTGLRSRIMTLNGRDLQLGENDELPCLCGKEVSGKVEIPATACAFVVL